MLVKKLGVNALLSMLRLIHMYPAEAKVDHLLLTIIFYDCFHQKNTSEA